MRRGNVEVLRSVEEEGGDEEERPGLELRRGGGAAEVMRSGPRMICSHHCFLHSSKSASPQTSRLQHRMADKMGTATARMMTFRGVPTRLVLSVMMATTVSSSHPSQDRMEYETRNRSSSTGGSFGLLLVNCANTRASNQVSLHSGRCCFADAWKEWMGGKI